MQPDKINLASLGNVVPHLHWHVIARWRWDAYWPQSAWSAPQRSAEAAREIKALIQASTSDIDAGARLVNDAGLTMEEIVSQAQRVSDFIAEISKATREQSEEITEVGKAVAGMDLLTQQNAELVARGATASASLQRQARQLVEAISVFR